MRIFKALGGVFFTLALLAVLVIVGIVAIAGAYLLWIICIGAFTLGALMLIAQAVWESRPQWMRRSR